jgi:hypothetical protein
MSVNSESSALPARIRARAIIPLSSARTVVQSRYRYDTGPDYANAEAERRKNSGIMALSFPRAGLAQLRLPAGRLRVAGGPLTKGCLMISCGTYFPVTVQFVPSLVSCA